jgi:protein arginine kinase activator
MLCEKCHKREAVLKFTQIIGEEKKSLNLCKTCAEEQGLSNPLVDISKVFGKLIIAILSEHLSSKTDQLVSSEEDKRVCSGCGLSWVDFKTTGRLGCPQCYDTYLEDMKNLLRRLHGSNRHIGKTLLKTTGNKKESIRSLKKKLQKAIEKEEYELAAELRDLIRNLTQ